MRKLPLSLLMASLMCTLLVSQVTVPRFDHIKGNWLNFETHPMAPLFLEPLLGDYLFAVNSPGLRLSVIYLPSNTVVAQIPAGPGPASVAGRPNSTELWLVDSITHSVSVYNVVEKRIIRTIHVGKEPHGLAFLESGERAYVSCSADSRVDVIDASSYSVVKSIAIPSFTPRGLAIQNGKVWVAPLVSGNNTATKDNADQGEDADEIVDLAQEALVNPATIQLPDRDLMAIDIHPTDPLQDQLDASAEKTGLGTILFNVHARPGSDELWIPNTEALNTTIGEKNFIRGQVVENRISIVDTGTSGVGSPAILTLKQCSQPMAVAFDAARDRAFIACSGSDKVQVYDSVTRQGIGNIQVPAQDGLRSMPSGLWFRDNELIVYNKGTLSYNRIDLSGGLPVAAATHHPLGYDPTPEAVKKGRGHIFNAEHSGSGESSCGSCHMFGHTDSQAWNLNAALDPAGTADPQFFVDEKGPMVTQSLRGLFETFPLHWRGEQETLEAFNGAFIGLLKRPGGKLSERDFDDLEAYVFSLVYPSNPRQNPQPTGTLSMVRSRDYQGLAANGHEHFQGINTSEGFLTCSGCHTLPLATNGEVQRVLSMPSPATVVAQLRGVQDKLAPPFDIAGDIGIRTETGIGLTHSGVIPSLEEFMLDPRVNAEPKEVDTGVAFMSEIDTGLAPCTAYQETFHTANTIVQTPTGPAMSQFFQDSFNDLIAQAELGNCDIILAGSLQDAVGAWEPRVAFYDRLSGLFQLERAAATQIDAQFVFDFIQGTGQEISMMGVPVGFGRRWGGDFDNDGLLNLDELSHGLDPLNPDWDKDGFPDGHEIANGMDPKVQDSTSTDVQNPQFVDDQGQSCTSLPDPSVCIKTVYSTSNTIKIEFQTDEPTVAAVFFTNIQLEHLPSPAAGGFDTTHSMVVNLLPPGATLPTSSLPGVDVHITDPAGNSSQLTMAVFQTLPVIAVARVADITFGSFDNIASTIEVTAHLSRQFGGALGCDKYSVQAFAYYEDDATPLTDLQPANSFSQNDLATFTLSLSPGSASGRQLHFGVINVTPPPANTGCGSRLPYVEAHDFRGTDDVKTYRAHEF